VCGAIFWDYLRAVAAHYFVGVIDGEPVCHLAVAPMFQSKAYRATRLVVMPEWQGIGVGTKFLSAICRYHLDGHGRCGHKYPTFFHTSHPQLCTALRHLHGWKQAGVQLYGGNKARSSATMKKSRFGREAASKATSGYGGHFRAVQAFKYIGGNGG